MSNPANLDRVKALGEPVVKCSLQELLAEHHLLTLGLLLSVLDIMAEQDNLLHNGNTLPDTWKIQSILIMFQSHGFLDNYPQGFRNIE